MYVENCTFSRTAVNIEDSQNRNKYRAYARMDRMERFTIENEHTRNNGWVNELIRRKGFCMLDPCLLDIYRKHPYVHFDATIRFGHVFYDFRISSVNLEGFGYWGVAKHGVFFVYVFSCMYVLHVFYRANPVLCTQKTARFRKPR